MKKYMKDNEISKLDLGGEQFSFETQIYEQDCNVSYALYKPNIKRKFCIYAKMSHNKKKRNNLAKKRQLISQHVWIKTLIQSDPT